MVIDHITEDDVWYTLPSEPEQEAVSMDRATFEKQEICKERTIIKREYMTGLSLGTYIFSKIVVLGVMCLIQSLLITGVFGMMIGVPEKGVFLLPFAELLITTFITAVASSAMGLFVSSLFTNADRAMTVAPLRLKLNISYIGAFLCCPHNLGQFMGSSSRAAYCKRQCNGSFRSVGISVHVHYMACLTTFEFLYLLYWERCRAWCGKTQDQ